MKEIWIRCPHCRKSSKLFLTSRPFLMVLRCPVCRKTLLNSEGKTYAIDNLNGTGMKGKPIQSFVEGLKGGLPNQISGQDYKVNQIPAKAGKNSGAQAFHKMGEPVRTSPVSKDDLLNLRIVLESCRDVTEFINRM